MTTTPGTSTTALARAATVAAVLAGTAMLGTAAAYATVGQDAPPPRATTRVEPAQQRATDGLAPVRLHQVYRVPFAQLASAGGR